MGSDTGENHWIQADFGQVEILSLLVLAPPSDNQNNYVKTSTLGCSLDGIEFTPIPDVPVNTAKKFAGSSEISYHYVWPHKCRYVRLYVNEFENRPALRWDLIKCPPSKKNATRMLSALKISVQLAVCDKCVFFLYF